MSSYLMSSIELVSREGLFSAWIYHKFHSGVKEWKYSLVLSEMVKLYQYLFIYLFKFLAALGPFLCEGFL